MKRAITDRVETALQLPAGTLQNGVRMEVTDNRRVAVEGCRKIVVYTADCICLDTAAGVVRFTGQNLCMQALRGGNTVITGVILMVEYL